MFTKHRIFTMFVAGVVVCAAAVSQVVRAAWMPNPTAFLLRLEDLGANAKVQVETRLNSQNSGPISGFVDGARRDFMVPTIQLRFAGGETRLGNTYIANFSYQFANRQLAELEFNKVQSETFANKGAIISVALPAASAWKAIAFEANLKEDLAGTTVRWLFAQRDEYLVALMMPGPLTPQVFTRTPSYSIEAYGDDNANRYNVFITALFNRLSEKLLSR